MIISVIVIMAIMTIRIMMMCIVIIIIVILIVYNDPSQEATRPDFRCIPFVSSMPFFHAAVLDQMQSYLQTAVDIVCKQLQYKLT